MNAVSPTHGKAAKALLGAMSYAELCAFFLVDPDSTYDPGCAILAEAIEMRAELGRLREELEGLAVLRGEAHRVRQFARQSNG